MAKKFSSEFDLRGTVKVTDKLPIQNIDTGAVEYCTVAELLTAFSISVLNGNVSIGTAASGNTLTLGLLTGTPISVLRISGGNSGAGTSKIWLAGVSREWELLGDGANTDLRVNYIGEDAHVSNIAVFKRDGKVGFGTAVPTSKMQVVGLSEYNDNAAASGAGLTVGAFYRTGDALKVVH